MKAPNPESGPGTLLRHGRRTQAMLRANRKTVKFVGRMKPKQDTLKKAQLKLNDAEDAVIDANAGVEMIDLSAMDIVTELELIAFAEVKKKRDDPLYRSLFPRGLTAIKEMAEKEFRDTELNRLIAELKKRPQSSGPRQFLKPLEGIVQEIEDPIKALGEAELKRSMADTALMTAKEEWLDAYVSLHGALEEAFPRQKSFVEAFFPKSKPAKRNGTEAARPSAAP